jgi:hypothetical protein
MWSVLISEGIGGHLPQSQAYKLVKRRETRPPSFQKIQDAASCLMNISISLKETAAIDLDKV